MKKHLYNAIFDLMQDHRIDQISTDMILKKSDLSRATFYRYFKDKYDLMNWYYASYIKEELFHSEDSWEQICNKSAEFIYERKPFFQNAIKYKGQNSFIEFIQKYYQDFCTATYVSRNKTQEISTELKFAIDYHCAGTVQILISWVNSDMELSPQELAELLCNNMPDILKSGLNAAAQPHN
ncbi:TetR/AcrR family transcriptional regulator C-terminal domain-containing protein [Paenibacillus sp. NPDC056722]|uniref:TetR/AcrR family transcriptional regulator C-terminal domain-containing protein n=1 Tax=Paenibacillus sp. NPDC056722 TaxID=3345924 RepID=UPI0036985A6B